MNTQKLILMLLPVLVAVLLSSCNKDETDTNDRAYLDDITGTYSGEFTTDTSQEVLPRTAVVTKTSDDELQIHCYGEIMDTTFIMDAYENGDSVMLCNTGDDFYNEYGHMGNGYHMMDMGMGQSEWMHHLEEDHQAGDEHFGGFNMMEIHLDTHSGKCTMTPFNMYISMGFRFMGKILEGEELFFSIVLRLLIG